MCTPVTIRSILKVAVLLSVTAICSVACHGGITEAGCLATPLTKGASDAIVGCCDICVPARTFLLIRHGRSIGALRFSALHHADPDDSSIGCAEYELYERSDGMTTFRDGHFKRSTGRVSRLESHGIHPFVVQDGHWGIPVAGTMIDYSPLSCVKFPNDTELAPTTSSDIATIDAAGPSVRWFTSDPTGTREAIVIPNR
jgi:hypothetical protein